MEEKHIGGGWIFLHRKGLVLIFILLLQVAFAIFWGTQKVGFHVDEIYSYGLSNGHEQPFLCDQESYYNQWHESDYINEYLSVSESERFSYGKVYDNQTQDVHPPLFYFLLHTVCSFFPGRFSKWFCICINLACFCATIVLIYQFSRRVFRNSWFSIIPAVCYGFTLGAINSIIYLRMYMLLTMLCMLFLRLSQKYWRQHRFKHSTVILLGIVTFLGMFTHYYFMIFIFFAFLCYLLLLVLQKRAKEAVIYSVTVFLGFLASILVYPSMLVHLFGGYRGREALENAVEGSQFFQKLGNYLGIINLELFGGFFWVAIIGIVLSLIVCFFLHKYDIRIKSETDGWKFYLKVREPEKKERTYKLYISKSFPDAVAAGVVSIGFVLAISILTTVQEDRYIFCVFPILMITICSVIWKIAGYLKRNWIVYTIVIVVLITTNALAFFSEGPAYLYKDDGDAANAICEYYSDYDCIYVTNNSMGWIANKDYYLLKQFPRVCFVKGETLEEQKSLLEQNNGKVIVFVTKEYDQKVTADRIMNMLGFSQCSGLYDTGNSMSYSIY